MVIRNVMFFSAVRTSNLTRNVYFFCGWEHSIENSYKMKYNHQKITYAYLRPYSKKTWLNVPDVQCRSKTANNIMWIAENVKMLQLIPLAHSGRRQCLRQISYWQISSWLWTEPVRGLHTRLCGVLTRKQSLKIREISDPHGGEYEIHRLRDVAPGSLVELTDVSEILTTYLHWKWLQSAPLRCRSICKRLHGTISQKTVIFMLRICSRNFIPTS
jgi:hypothetical protein